MYGKNDNFAPRTAEIMAGGFMSGHVDDSLIFEALQQNDERMFRHLFVRYYPRLKSYSMRFVRDEETVKDIIQDCFAKLWEKRHSLTAVSISSLLFTMVRNSCFDYLKHKLVVDRSMVSEAFVSSMGGELLYNIDFGRYSDDSTLYSELVSLVGSILAGLPERTREIFIKSRLEGLKNREISEELGISVTAVEKHISRALAALSSGLKKIYPVTFCDLLLLMILSGLM